MHSFSLVVFLTVFSFIISWSAYLRGYYDLPFRNVEGPLIKTYEFILIFLGFLILFFLIGPIIISFILTLQKANSLNTQTLLVAQNCINLLIATLIVALCFGKAKNRFRRIWKDYLFPGSEGIEKDILTGFLTWFIATPIVLAVSMLVELICNLTIGEVLHDQMAVILLKEAMKNPFSYVLALIAIIIGAPIVEEYIYRGILQSYLRTKLGYKNAIIFSSFLFALFHFSPAQNLLNIPLLISLFVFGGYLGFVYEKRRSLFASISLHVTFNFISVMKIIYMN